MPGNAAHTITSGPVTGTATTNATAATKQPNEIMPITNNKISCEMNAPNADTNDNVDASPCNDISIRCAVSAPELEVRCWI